MLASSVGEWPLCGLPPRGSLMVAVYKDLPPFNTEDPRFATEPLPSPRAPRNGWAVGCAVKTAPVDLAQGLCGAMNGLAATGKLRKMFAKQHVAWHGT